MSLNKIRYWLGLRTICHYRGKYVWTRKVLGILREYYDAGDCMWWTRTYSGSFFNTVEEAMKALDCGSLRPVEGI